VSLGGDIAAAKERKKEKEKKKGKEKGKKKINSLITKNFLILLKIF
jgi:hypothetical protein